MKRLILALNLAVVLAVAPGCTRFPSWMSAPGVSSDDPVGDSEPAVWPFNLRTSTGHEKGTGLDSRAREIERSLGMDSPR